MISSDALRRQQLGPDSAWSWTTSTTAWLRLSTTSGQPLSRSPKYALSAFLHRMSLKRGQPVAAVATARKLAVLIWHMLTKEQDYTWVRPALRQYKLRALELKSGRPSRRGGKTLGPARDYSIKPVRDAEQAYENFVASWKEQPPVKGNPPVKGESL